MTQKRISLIVCLALALVMIFALASCGGGNTDGGDDKEEAVEYKITFKQEGFDDVVKTVKAGKNLSRLPTPKSVEGYEFEWDNIKLTNIQSDMTVTAIKTPIKYSIFYMLDGGVNGDNPEEYTIEDKVTLKDPSRVGYEFDGWYTDRDFENPVSGISLGETGQKTFYAKWNAGDSKIYFAPNGGVGVMGSMTVPTGEVATLNKNTFTKEGYTFVGWSASESGVAEYQDGGSITITEGGEYTLYAVWEPNINTLILVANNGTDEKKEIPVRVGQETLLRTGFTKTGYTIRGWATSENGSVEYENNTLFTMGLENPITLYAVWELSINQLILDMNDGSGKQEIVNIESFATSDIPLLTYVREGYNFKGWSTSSDGEVEYEDGASYTMGTNSQYTLYAIWRGTEYTITYHDADGNITDEAVFTAEDLPYKLLKLSDTSTQLFECWYTSPELMGEPLRYLNEIGNVDLYPSYVDGTKGLTLVEIDGGYEVSMYEGSAVSVVIPSTFCGKSVISIGKDAFRGCNTIVSISLPSQLQSIGEAAFLSCHSLVSIEIPKTVTAIGKQAFSYCYKLPKLVIPNGVTSLGQYAFMNCESLKSITLPEEMTEIEYQAFYGCISLVDITIPETVVEIEAQAFKYCESLIGMIIPDSVASIGTQAFYSCTNLETIVIPDELVSMGTEVFGFCENLTTVNIPKGISSISARTFIGCESLQSVVIPGNINTIGSEAFRQCKALTTIVVPDSVTTIESYAFALCTRLSDVTLSKSLVTIGANAFNGCALLRQIKIPMSVLSIGENAFYDCESTTGRLVISCEIDEKPLGWSDKWNNARYEVIWNAK